MYGEKSGLGRQRWPDGSIYIGDWKNNMIHEIVRSQLNLIGQTSVEG